MSEKHIQDVSVALMDNSLDFIEKGLESILSDDPTEYKYSILHLYSGILLFLKDILYQEHWTLIFQNVDEASKAKLNEGNFKSVDFHTLLKRIEATSDYEISEKLLKDLKWMQKQRNQIEHFHVNINAHEVKSRIAGLLNNLLIDINKHKVENGFTDDNDVDNYYYKYISLIELLHAYSFRFEEFIQKRNHMIKDGLFECEIIIVCPNCNQDTLEISHFENKAYCHFCLNNTDIDSFLFIHCDKYFNSIHFGYESNNCPCCQSLMLYEFNNNIYCLECSAKSNVNDLSNCTACNNTIIISKEDDGIDLCDNCLSHFMNRMNQE